MVQRYGAEAGCRPDGYADVKTADRCMALGADEVITKPVNLARLRAVISNHEGFGRRTFVAAAAFLRRAGDAGKWLVALVVSA